VEAFDSALETLGDSTRLVVRVAPGALERVRPVLEQTAAEHGFSGMLVMRPQAGAAPGDITIEWSEGAVEFNSAALMARFEAALAEHDWGIGPEGQEERAP
jgi:flagellar biosynthesis/type III secretory pathway protein FliH